MQMRRLQTTDSRDTQRRKKKRKKGKRKWKRKRNRKKWGGRDQTYVYQTPENAKQRVQT